MITQVKNELDCMEKMEVIRKVSEPTEVGNGMVVVEKPRGDVRMY